MERNANETFDAYKARRANSNAAVKRINQKSKRGGTRTARQIQREERDNSKHAGSYGRNLLNSFAALLATQDRLDKHFAYLESSKIRKMRRAA